MIDEPTEQDLPEQIRVRMDKRAKIIANGGEAYPVGVPVTAQIADVRARYGDLEDGVETTDRVGVAGRVVFIRNTGKLCFATIQDGEGERLQIMLSLDAVGEEALAAFKTDIDLGDHLFAEGPVGKSRRGEVSVFAHGEKRALGVLGPGSFFGEMGLMTGAPRTATAQARTDLECYRLDKAGFRDLLVSRPALADEISHIITARTPVLSTAQDDAMERAVHGAGDPYQELLGRIRRFFGLSFG